MTKQEITRKVDDFIMDGNYIAAFGYLKEYMSEDPVRMEYGGKIAMAIMEEIEGLPHGSDGKQRLLYLRSILMWIFRDFPGLSGLYRDELKNAGERADPVGDLMRNLKNLGDLAGAGNTTSEQVRDTFETIKRNIDDTMENLGSGNTEEQVQKFFSNVESGFKEGVNIAADFFRSMESKPESVDTDESKDSDDTDIRDVTEDE